MSNSRSNQYYNQRLKSIAKTIYSTSILRISLQMSVYCEALQNLRVLIALKPYTLVADAGFVCTFMSRPKLFKNYLIEGH